MGKGYSEASDKGCSELLQAFASMCEQGWRHFEYFIWQLQWS